MKLISIVITTAISLALLSSVLIPIVETSEGKEDLYVFGVFGQSNAAYGYGDLTIVNTEIPPISSNTAYYFGDLGNPIMYAASPNLCQIRDMCPDDSWLISNFEPSFCKTLAEDGRKSVVINVGCQGRNVSELMPGGTCWDWEVNTFSNALSKIDTSRYNIIMGSMLWLQGEADGAIDTPPDIYKERFLTLWDALKLKFGFDGCLITVVRDARGTEIPFAQKELANEYSDIHLSCTSTEGFTVANGMMHTDNTHYTQYADDVIGAENAEYWLENVAKEQGKTFGEELIKLIPFIIGIGLVLGVIITFVKRTEF